MNASTGTWRLRGGDSLNGLGTILGGMVVTTEGALLTVYRSTRGTLRDVHIAGTVDVPYDAALSLEGLWRNRGALRVGGTLNLGGLFTTTAVGTIERTGGMINFTGTLENSQQVLHLNASTGPWFFLGGRINGGTVTLADGVRLSAVGSGGTLNGVTVNGEIYANRGGFRVTNGLTLNGLLNLDNHAIVAFDGTQTLSGKGTIYFDLFIDGGGEVRAEGGTLTLAPSITVRGILGSILADFNQGAIVNQGTIIMDRPGADLRVGGVLNQGTIIASAPGGTLTLSGNWRNVGTLTLIAGTLSLGGRFRYADLGSFQRVEGSIVLSGTLDNQNQTFTPNAATGSWRMQNGTVLGGTVRTADGAQLLLGNGGGTLDGVSLETDVTIPSGSRLTFAGGWRNRGRLALDNGNGTLNLGGSFTLAALGTLVRSGGTVNLTGTLENATDTLTLNDTTGSWRVDGGIINGGTVVTTGAARLLIDTGRLNGVTVNGSLDAATGGFSATNGLTVNGTLVVGFRGLAFEGSQTLGGTVVVTQTDTFSAVGGVGGTVTLGPGVTVRDQVRLGNFLNQGTLEVVTPGRTLSLEGTWRNSGLVRVTNGTLRLGGTFRTADLGTIQRTGGEIALRGVLDNRDATLALNASSGAWVLDSGNILGGTVTTEDGIILRGIGTLDGVLMQGDIEVTGGQFSWRGYWSHRGSLRLTNGTLSLGGAFTLADLGTLQRSGGRVLLAGMLYNANRTLALNATTGSWEMAGGSAILGGTITTADGVRLETLDNSSAGARLEGVTVLGTLFARSSKFVLTGRLTVNGTIILGESNNYSGSITATGAQVLDGTGTILIGYANGSALGGTTGELTLGPNITVRGAVGQLSGINNQGTILIDDVRADARLDGNWRNTGLIRLSTGILSLAGTFNPTTLGNFQRLGGTVNLVGTLDTRTIPFTFNAATGSWFLRQGTIRGGTVTLTEGVTLIPTSNGGILDGVTLQGDLSLADTTVLTYTGVWRHQGRLTMTGGTANLGGNFTRAGLPQFQRTGGTVNLTGVLDLEDGSWTFDTNASLWRMAGGLFINGTVACAEGVRLVADGVQNGGFQRVTLNCNLDVINSRLRVTSDLIVNGIITLGSIGNYGALFVGNGSRLLGTGLVVFQGSDSARNAIAILGDSSGNTFLVGPNLTIRADMGGTIGYHPMYSGTTANLVFTNEGTLVAGGNGQTLTITATSIQNRGTLQVSNNSTLALQRRELLGHLVNLGTLLVLDGSLTTNDVLTQLDGATILFGGSLTAPWFDLRGGALVGSGAIYGNVYNEAMISVGFDGYPGILAIVGDYTQSSAGVLALRIGGYEPGVSHDYFYVSGRARLDGLFYLTLAEEFVANPFDVFTLMGFGTRENTFAAYAGLDPKGQQVYFEPFYDERAFYLVAVPN